MTYDIAKGEDRGRSMSADAYEPVNWADYDNAPSTQRYELGGWEEDISTDAIPDKYILTISRDGEEFAVIIHRTCKGTYPLDGEVAEQKIQDGALIVAALNAYELNNAHRGTL